MDNDAYLNQISSDRLAARQVDELIGLTRGLCADGAINQLEAEFLQSWLAVNAAIIEIPMISELYRRIESSLADDLLDSDEQQDLLQTLRAFSGDRIELGEVLKPTSLPLCDPAPVVDFTDRQFVFTGTFMIGQRKECGRLVVERGGMCGGLTKRTNFLIVGEYATESWKHSSMGTKILKACEMRDSGIPISIVSESHWKNFL